MSRLRRSVPRRPSEPAHRVLLLSILLGWSRRDVGQRSECAPITRACCLPRSCTGSSPRLVLLGELQKTRKTARLLVVVAALSCAASGAAAGAERSSSSARLTNDVPRFVTRLCKSARADHPFRSSAHRLSRSPGTGRSQASVECYQATRSDP